MVMIPNKTVEKQLPTLITSKSDPTQVIGLAFIDDGKKYYFSNDQGHKVIQQIGLEERPMTKNEFKEIRAKMAASIISHPEFSEELVAELEKLNFKQGHANGTFEIVTPCMSTSKIGALVINLGNARYIYNQDANTVFHIDHSKRINGAFLQEGQEKEEIIHKISSSKTMAKKISALH